MYQQGIDTVLRFRLSFGTSLVQYRRIETSVLQSISAKRLKSGSVYAQYIDIWSNTQNENCVLSLRSDRLETL